MRGLLCLVLLLILPLLLGADRHVYLNQSGGGTQLDDCPNPAHNAKGTSNTDELEYCVGGGAQAGKVIGTATGRISSATCTGAGGTVTAVTNGVSADVDGDGTNEAVYGHPQACVWNMAKSDSCEIHAGTYAKPGAECDEACGYSELSGSTTTCQKSDCWLASIVAFGDGPNLASNAECQASTDPYPCCTGSGTGSCTGDGTGNYGTLNSPGWVRGANSNNSRDTWDSDDDKIPDCNGNSGSAVCWGECSGGNIPNSLCTVDADCPGSGTCTHTTYSSEPTSYPAILSGDFNGDGMMTHTATSCTASSCSGDGYFGLIGGPGPGGASGYAQAYCIANEDDAGGHYVRIDSDADGALDTDICQRSVPDPSWLKVRDLEFSGYNGGHNSYDADSAHARHFEGRLNFEGDGSSAGFLVDHVFMHHGDYAYTPGQEFAWAEVSDGYNNGCASDSELKNSFIVQNNEKLFNNDNNPTNGAGCGWKVHDNKFVIDINSTNATGRTLAVFAYIKSIDQVELSGTPRAKKLWFYNNEFAYIRAASNGPDVAESTGIRWHFYDLQSFGDAQYADGIGHGVISFHGNLFRQVRASTSNWTRPYRGYISACDGDANGGTLDTNDFTYYQYNNTFITTWQTSDAINTLCDGEDEGDDSTMVEKNNTYIPRTGSGIDFFIDETGESIDLDCIANDNPWACCTALDTGPECLSAPWTNYVHTIANETETTNSATCSSWFADCTTTPNLINGLTLYSALVSGSLDEISANTPCDPDGDGVAGSDYDGDGDNDTSWTDIAGNLVACPTTTTAIDLGAIQSGSDNPIDIQLIFRGAKLTGAIAR